MTKDQICKLFGCSIEQINNQFKANAEGLKRMEHKAISTGKKVNNFTAEQLTQYRKKYELLAND